MSFKNFHLRDDFTTGCPPKRDRPPQGAFANTTSSGGLFTSSSGTEPERVYGMPGAFTDINKRSRGGYNTRTNGDQAERNCNMSGAFINVNKETSTRGITNVPYFPILPTGYGRSSSRDQPGDSRSYASALMNSQMETTARGYGTSGSGNQADAHRHLTALVNAKMDTLTRGYGSSSRGSQTDAHPHLTALFNTKKNLTRGYGGSSSSSHSDIYRNHIGGVFIINQMSSTTGFATPGSSVHSEELGSQLSDYMDNSEETSIGGIIPNTTPTSQLNPTALDFTPSFTQGPMMSSGAGRAGSALDLDITSGIQRMSLNNSSREIVNYRAFDALAPPPSKFPDADERYPVGEYNGPPTAEAIVDHYVNIVGLPFAPSRHKIEVEREKRANAAGIMQYSNTSVNDGGSQTVPILPQYSARAANTYLPQAHVQARVRRGTNYKGDFDFEVENLPMHLNCKVWVQKIPASATRKEIFAAIKEGRIAQFSYSKADFRHHHTAAASIAFAELEATHAFLARAQRGEVFINGTRVSVVVNRSKAKDESELGQTRIIRVFAPYGELNLERLLHLLNKFIQFTLVDAAGGIEDGRSVVDLEFESIVGQSRSAVKMLLQMAKAELKVDVHVKYVRDPCDPCPEPSQPHFGVFN
ncbi:hypothetical protein BJ878DRAFT_566959 [Calycina marina]|uniref:RRM domain-containing protein n=1 Tax=Calycina marina TaxID=1763456 RepID=A0A9P7Z4C1_9HELO|nr:hypothetical protein BJ878DRAFT_566959 [Calycina marina]